ncbi:acetyl-CoA carboxylase biotin carboxylase subunit family protein [Amycolatopsis sp. BJA-103]|uniref:ATP-grasp domain-containing protein n=1 Tax=Amycolatopsis sp. BJA-103 TaxID=1911175 RepID=UPI0013047ED2|nr:ATP-grasp domain-containing protein [Amycolatopsis sp. BJA-103]
MLAISQPRGSAMVQRGLELLGTEGHPFAGLADVALHDGGDLSGIVDQASRWARDFEITGVLVAAEVYVEAGQQICDLLELPGVGMRAARVCRNKLLQRRYLPEWSPKSVLVSERTGSATYDGPFPAAVKPLDRESSIGVRVVHDASALAGILEELAPGSRLLVEERVVGREYNVDSIVLAGEPIVTLLTQKGTNEESTEFFVELVHTTPPVNLDERETDLISEAQRAVVERLDFDTGFAHAEYRLTEDGRVVLMEIAARAPGDACLPLYHLATGQAIEPVLIDAAMGLPTGYKASFRRRGRQVYFVHTPGTLLDVRTEGTNRVRPRWLADTTGIWPPLRPVGEQAPATLHELFVLKKRGDLLAPITESSNRAVTAIFDAPLDEDIDIIEARIRRSVTIDTEPANTEQA